MRIMVLCPYPEGRAPGQRLKFEQYYPSWRDAGFEVDVRPFWSETAWYVLHQPGHVTDKLAGLIDGYRRRLRDLRDAIGVDLVYVFLETLPLGLTVVERLIYRAHVPIVYDLDDLVYRPHSSAANPFMRTVRRLRGSRKVCLLLRLSSQVIVTNDYLREFAEKVNPSVTSIWPTVDLDRYPPRGHHDRADGVVLGWSGSHSTSPYLLALTTVLRELQEADGAVVKVLGDPDFTMPGVHVTAQPWSLSTEIMELSEMDIGLHPLPDEEWVQGKAGGKMIQYMALGIPTVAQRIGSNLDLIENGRNGFLASTPDEWLTILRRLVHDPGLRQRIGAEGRRTVVERYSVEANESRYLDVLRGALHV